MAVGSAVHGCRLSCSKLSAELFTAVGYLHLSYSIWKKEKLLVFAFIKGLFPKILLCIFAKLPSKIRNIVDFSKRSYKGKTKYNKFIKSGTSDMVKIQKSANDLFQNFEFLQYVVDIWEKNKCIFVSILIFLLILSVICNIQGLMQPPPPSPWEQKIHVWNSFRAISGLISPYTPCR